MYESSGIAFPVPVQEDTARVRTPLDGGNSIYSSDTPTSLDKMIDPSSIRRAANKKAIEKRRFKASQELMEKEAKAKAVWEGVKRIFKKPPAYPAMGGTIPKTTPTTAKAPPATKPTAAPKVTPETAAPKGPTAEEFKALQARQRRAEEIQTGKVFEKGHPFRETIQPIYQSPFSRWATGGIGEQVLGMGSFIALPMLADLLGLGLPGQIASFVAAPLASGYLTKGFQAGKQRALAAYSAGKTPSQARQAEAQRLAQAATV